MQWHDCIICHEVPEGRIHQCPNGHFSCAECLAHVSICPSCREPVDREHPIRALGVEQAIAALSTTCTNNGCALETTRGLLQAHEQVCPFRPSSCPIEGCPWTGLASEAETHAASCPHGLVARALIPLQTQLTQLTTQSIQQQMATQALHQQLATKTSEISALRQAQEVLKSRFEEQARRHREESIMYRTTRQNLFNGEDSGVDDSSQSVRVDLQESWFPIHFRVLKFFKDRHDPNGDYYPVPIDDAILALEHEGFEPQEVVDAADRIITQGFLLGCPSRAGHYQATEFA